MVIDENISIENTIVNRRKGDKKKPKLSVMKNIKELCSITNADYLHLKKRGSLQNGGKLR